MDAVTAIARCTCYSPFVISPCPLHTFRDVKPEAAEDPGYVRHGIGSLNVQEVWPVKARKSFTCASCGAAIAAGTVYIRKYEEYGHPIRTSTWCVDCAGKRWPRWLRFGLDPKLSIGDLPV